jgi:hypothetical protein
MKYPLNVKRLFAATTATAQVLVNGYEHKRDCRPSVKILKRAVTFELNLGIWGLGDWGIEGLRD